MKIQKLSGYVFLIIAALSLAGCESIPADQLKNYALIESRIGHRGSDMDTLSPSMAGRENTAFVSYVNGEPYSRPFTKINVLPGRYTFQVGLGCDNTATCRPGSPFDLKVEAGKRYVLTPSGVLVSDRFQSRNGEVRYSAPSHF